MRKWGYFLKKILTFKERKYRSKIDQPNFSVFIFQNYWVIYNTSKVRVLFYYLLKTAVKTSPAASSNGGQIGLPTEKQMDLEYS